MSSSRARFLKTSEKSSDVYGSFDSPSHSKNRMSQVRYEGSHNDDSPQYSKNDRSSLIVSPLSKLLYSPDGSPSRISRSSPTHPTSILSCSTPEFLSDTSPFSSMKPSPFENRILALAAANWKPPDNGISPVVRTSQFGKNISQRASRNSSGSVSSFKATTYKEAPATKSDAKDVSDTIPPKESPLADSSPLSAAKSVPVRGKQSFGATTVSSPDNAKETLQGSVLLLATVEDTLDTTPARLYIDTDSPLTPLPADYDDSKKALKRTRADSESPAFLADRRRRSRTRKENLTNNDLQPSPTEDADTNHTITLSFPGNRTFPPRVHIHHGFPMFYRCYPASSYFQRENDQLPTEMFKRLHPGGTYNCPRSAFDLYSPRFVKGIGRTKMGLCPICIECSDRGGEGKQVWLSMKFSAFKRYHLQYVHGISAVTARPFSPPVAFRTSPRPNAAKTERSQILEGKCHRCNKWVPIEGIKDIEAKVKEIFWWKHAAACHQNSTLAGEEDIFLQDAVYTTLKEL